MLRDYVQCIKFGSNGEMVRGLRLLGGLLYSRFKYDMGPLHYSLFRFADTSWSEWGSYIRNQQFSTYVVKNRVPDELHDLVKDKVRFYQHCIARDIPTRPSFAYSAGILESLPTVRLFAYQTLTAWKTR